MSFEIRVICAPADMVRISTALGKAFQTGLFRSVPTRDRQSRRLYVTADHHPAPELWTTPEDAYATAPTIVCEIAWIAAVARRIVARPSGDAENRDYWLRKAALLDRIALQGETDGFHGEACEAAYAAARRLIALDGATGFVPSRDGAPCSPHLIESPDPRGYVRQEYARWAKHQ
ncbi:hypothetical protein [Streptomyces prunicolor]|uniref:Uncharacterized protein n=1 Tax=Streptomyces prunicolor TaxID=67348 RepID=A0ABU4F3T1_9ACTN|nr:hypothetical protein [Streptomyces prunicolor]MDV7215248.1 hypothetical protein [Streptomyces prunicolor]